MTDPLPISAPPMARPPATVIVLYHPPAATLDFVTALAAARAAPMIAVVNAATAADRERLASAPGLTLLWNEANLGLARAFNQGIDAALRMGAEWVMLLDQDSRPDPTMATRLVRLAEEARGRGLRVGAIGPTPLDRKRPAARTLAPGRPVAPGLAAPATIISAGTVLHRDAVAAAGGMWNELFIDHVDHEWCFRCAAAGFEVLAATGVTLDHDIGDAGFVVAGRYKPIHRSPVRHFHIVRNTLWLARRSFIPRRWRCREVAKLALRMPAYLLFSSDRRATARALAMAVFRGLGSPGPATYRS